MSAKNNKKKSGKKAMKWTIIAIEIVVLLAALLIWWAFAYDGDSREPTVPEEPITPETSATVPQVTVPEPVVEEIVDADAYLDESLKIENIGSYTGAFVEDGTNEIVSGVLMLVVSNVGEKDIQYAEITLPTENGNAKFTLSTLPVGESVVLLEQSRMAYNGNEDVSLAVSANVALFSEPLQLYEDQLEMQILNGAINVTNISGADIDGDIMIYYKNAATDLYYGGITYRVRIEGGMKAEEIKQIMASHFSQSGSKIMFVNIV